MKPSRSTVEESVLQTLSAFEPLTYRDYAAIAGIDLKAAFERVRRLWDQKVLHVVRYERGRSGKPVPHYGIGNAPDAPKPDPLPMAEKVAKYQASEKGQKALAKARRRRYAREKEMRQTDPVWAEKTRHYGREWSRKKYGHKPRRALVAVERFDPVLAALMGRKAA